MRASLVPFLFLTAACQQEAAAPTANEATFQLPEGIGQDLQVFAGEGRDRLCLNGTRSQAAFIAYAPSGDNNCMARGRLQAEGRGMVFAPEGDDSCRIPLSRDGGPTKLVLGRAGATCAYYCGPSASFEGKAFTRMEPSEPATDLAGDPLC